jgi:hypothetical protein
MVIGPLRDRNARQVGAQARAAGARVHAPAPVPAQVTARFSVHPRARAPARWLIRGLRSALGILAALGPCILALSLGACALYTPSLTQQVNRPDGEGYAGAGELVLRIGQAQEDKSSSNWFGFGNAHRQERSSIELRYVGLDAAGRAVFRRHDVDAIAGPPVAPAMEPVALAADQGGGDRTALPPDTRDIVIDMRLARQIRIQGKIVEIVEATPSGVVFRLY